jgi:2-polyprenyl-6-methoxyphenol hydroxylase-like FAD-dependent oxidoreductase
LRDEAVRRGISIEYGKRLAGAENLPRGGVVARFNDGTEAEGDLLIGADGLQSRTRRIIDPAAPEARYVGLLNTGGFVSGLSVPAEPGVMNFVFGKRCFFGYVLNPNGEVWWFANPPSTRELSHAELAAITPEQWRARLLDLFAGDVTPAVAIIRATPEIAAGWNTHDFPRVPTWHKGRMIIIGDAAHAASPASGQGAAMAFEDAVVLAKCLRDRPDIATAFTAYEGLRRERVERVVEQGKRNGNQKAAGPVGRVLRDLFMPIMLKALTRSGKLTQNWLYDYQIDWDAPAHPVARAA